MLNEWGRGAELRRRMVSVIAESDPIDLHGINALAKMAVKPSRFLSDGAFERTQKPEDTFTKFRVRKAETTHWLHQ
jgi:hypothetical protein